MNLELTKISVLVPNTSSSITFENSPPIFVGSTLLTVPFVMAAAFPRFLIEH